MECLTVSYYPIVAALIVCSYASTPAVFLLVMIASLHAEECRRLFLYSTVHLAPLYLICTHGFDKQGITNGDRLRVFVSQLLDICVTSC